MQSLSSKETPLRHSSNIFCSGLSSEYFLNPFFLPYVDHVLWQSSLMSAPILQGSNLLILLNLKTIFRNSRKRSKLSLYTVSINAAFIEHHHISHWCFSCVKHVSHVICWSPYGYRYPLYKRLRTQFRSLSRIPKHSSYTRCSYYTYLYFQ